MQVKLLMCVEHKNCSLSQKNFEAFINQKVVQIKPTELEDNNHTKSTSASQKGRMYKMTDGIHQRSNQLLLFCSFLFSSLPSLVVVVAATDRVSLPKRMQLNCNHFHD